MASDSIGVVAHVGKTLGGGLGELREVLAAAGHGDPVWCDVARGRQVAAAAREVLDQGVETLFVWGGDGTVRRCVDIVAGTETALAILPAGTGNLLARNLGIPQDVSSAVGIGLGGDRRVIDAATVNGDYFSVMAGAGLDARTMRDTDDGVKERIGRVAYLLSGARHLKDAPIKCKLEIDGRPFYQGKATCVLVGNLSEVVGGVTLFDGSRADDGVIEIGIVDAKSRTQWLRTLSRVVVGRAENSPFVVVGHGRSMRVRFNHKVDYELDGSPQPPTRLLKIKVRPSSLTVCVPREAASASTPDAKAG